MHRFSDHRDLPFRSICVSIEYTLRMKAMNPCPVSLRRIVCVIIIQVFIGLQVPHKGVSAVQQQRDAVRAMAWRSDDLSADSNS